MMRRGRNNRGGEPPPAVAIYLEQGRCMDDASPDRIPKNVMRTTHMMIRTVLTLAAVQSLEVIAMRGTRTSCSERRQVTAAPTDLPPIVDRRPR